MINDMIKEIMEWLFYSPMLTGAASSVAFAWLILVFCLFFWPPKKEKKDVVEEKGDSPVNVI